MQKRPTGSPAGRFHRLFGNREWFGCGGNPPVAFSDSSPQKGGPRLPPIQCRSQLADEVEGAVAGAAVESAEVAEEVETAEIAANETVDPTIEAEVSTTEEN